MVICMTQFFYFAVSLLGGLSIFIYSMSVMTESLKKLSEGKLEKSLKTATSNDFKGFIWGSIVTALLHSSSALTVMLVGLVNSGLLSFENTFGVIVGSNVGTTLNAWIIRLTGLKLDFLNPKFWVPLISFLGLFIKILSKDEKKQNIGLSLMGFSLLMYSMQIMSAAVEVVKNLAWFKDFLLTLESPITALLISSVFTGIIQSSSATIGIIETLTLTNPITYKIAIPLVLGANIGTCVTSLISSFGANKDAKRVVILHFALNILGSVICIAVMYLISPFGILDGKISMSGIALVHTLFNIISGIIFVPFKKALMELCKIITGGRGNPPLQIK